MTLAHRSWIPITIHNVVSEFLRGERDQNFHPPWLALIDNPNLNDPLENQRRLRLLYIRRGVFMIEIPNDTQWYEVTLAEDDIDDLYLSARHDPQWDGLGSKLDQVAAALQPKPEPLRALPDARIIQWGHEKSGPFTIIEGNHRMLSWAHSRPLPQLNISVYVGISPSYCFWHYADPALPIGQGLFRTYNIVAQNDWLYVLG
jgi:hypothetical protein